MAKAFAPDDLDVPAPRWSYSFLLRVSVPTTLAFGGLPLSGAAVGLVVGTSQVQLSQGKAADLLSNGWFVAGLVLAAVGVVFAGTAIGAVLVQSRDRRRPPLRIVFEDDDQLLAPLKDQRYVGVRVRNMGQLGLREVKLRLIARWPEGALHSFSLEHDPRPFERSLVGVSCPPGDWVRFEVARCGDDGIRLMYAHESLRQFNGFPLVGRNEAAVITLLAEGRREDDGRLAPSTTVQFNLFISDHDRLLLERVR